MSDGTKDILLLSYSPLSSEIHSNFLSFLSQTYCLVGLNCCFPRNTVHVITDLHTSTNDHMEPHLYMDE